MPYTIKQAAETTGLPASAIRYYDQLGLLPFLGRTEGKYRLFDEADIAMLRLVAHLKSIGMSLADIKQYSEWVRQGDETLPQRLRLFEKQKAAVEAQLDALQRTRTMLDYKCRYYEAAVARGTEEGLEDMPGGPKCPHHS